MADSSVIAGHFAPAQGADLLGAEEAPPWVLQVGRDTSHVLVVCDHAGNRLPQRLDGLGLNAARLLEHIAWDLGALAVARGLAEQLGAHLIYGRYSRLAVDLNRAPSDRSAIPAISDGVLIPRNVSLSDAQRAARIRALHDPYHDCIAQFVAQRLAKGIAPAVISVHSFTPRVSGIARPWEAGVLWDKDSRLAIPLLQGLRSAGVVVGDNEPYSGRHTADYTLDRHAEGNGLPHAAVELRQDCISNAGMQHIWAERLANALRPVLQQPNLYDVPVRDASA